MFLITYHLWDEESGGYKRDYEWQFDSYGWQPALAVLEAFGVDRKEVEAMRMLCQENPEEEWGIELEVPHGGREYGAVIDFAGAEGPYGIELVRTKDGKGFQPGPGYPERRLSDPFQRNHPEDYGQIRR